MTLARLLARNGAFIAEGQRSLTRPFRQPEKKSSRGQVPLNVVGGPGVSVVEEGRPIRRVVSHVESLRPPEWPEKRA